jgi:hypothetical protein
MRTPLIRPSVGSRKAVWLGAAVVGLVLLGSCLSRDLPLQDSRATPRFEIQDASHNAGNPRFYFLPPLVDQPSPTGDPDPSLLPFLAVEVCPVTLGECLGDPVTTITATSTPVSNGITVNENAEYVARWKTLGTGLEPGIEYRIKVSAMGLELGHIDLVAQRMHQQIPVEGTFVIGRTLPIRFRVERGAVLLPILAEVGPGVQSTLPDGPSLYPLNVEVAYAFEASPGFTTLTVRIDGQPAPANGVLRVNELHSVWAGAIPDLSAATSLVETLRNMSDATDMAAAYQHLLDQTADYVDTRGLTEAIPELAAISRVALDPVEAEALTEAVFSGLPQRAFSVTGDGVSTQASVLPPATIAASPNGLTVIVYVNGMLRDPMDAAAAMGTIRSLANQILASSGQRILVEQFPNRTAGVWRDLGQSINQFFQLLTLKPPDAETKDFIDYLQGWLDADNTRVMVISHSQGNFFSALGSQALTASEGQCFSALSLASPIPRSSWGSGQPTGFVVAGLPSRDVILDAIDALRGTNNDLDNDFTRIRTSLTDKFDLVLNSPDYVRVPGTIDLFKLKLDAQLHSLNSSYLGTNESKGMFAVQLLAEDDALQDCKSAPLASLEIVPSNMTLKVDEGMQATVIGRDASGNEVPIDVSATPVRWSRETIGSDRCSGCEVLRISSTLGLTIGITGGPVSGSAKLSVGLIDGTLSTSSVVTILPVIYEGSMDRTWLAWDGNQWIHKSASCPSHRWVLNANPATNRGWSSGSSTSDCGDPQFIDGSVETGPYDSGYFFQISDGIRACGATDASFSESSISGHCRGDQTINEAFTLHLNRVQ